MSKTKLLLFYCVLGFIPLPFIFFVENTNYQYLGGAFAILTNIILCLITSYFLIIKERYDILAGVTKEDVKRIESNQEEKTKIIKKGKTLGYGFFILAIVLTIILIIILYRNVI